MSNRLNNPHGSSHGPSHGSIHGPNNIPPNKIPLKKALLSILLSVFLISGTSFAALLYFNSMKESRRKDPKYQIVAVVQTSKDTEVLKTAYLTELLDLSVDRPMNLFSFDSKEGLAKLLNSPVIKEAKITKIKPGTIWVDYAMRKPFAILVDYANTMIDMEGIAFPMIPYFTPKRLPKIYLGRIYEGGREEKKTEISLAWGLPIQGKRIQLAFDLIEYTKKYCCNDQSHLARIDVSKAFALSCGQRQVVVIFEESCEKVISGRSVLCVYPRLLRLDVDNYEQQLKNYLVLRDHLQSQSEPIPGDLQGSIFYANAIVIDLRISDLAFIEVQEESS